MHGLQAPTYEDIERYSVNRPDALEIISEPIFDFAAYPAAGTRELTFFQNQVGSGGKNFEDTNMKGNGFMPTPTKFMVTGLAVEYYPAALPGRSAAPNVSTNWNDCYKILKSGLLTLNIGDKPFLTQGPIGMFPPTYRLAGASALTGQSAVANGVDGVDYAVFAGKEFRIIPLTLPSTQNFNVTLSWATLVTVTAEARIGVRLFGFKYRAVQ